MMPRRFLMLFCLLFVQLQTVYAKTHRKNVTIKGHITRTSDYCGGAMPTEEMLAQLKSPRPDEGRIIYVRIGSVNKATATIIKKVVTDANGDFTVVLKSGVVYSFVEEWKGKPLKIPEDTEYTKWDARCFRERYAKSDFVLKVKPSKNALVTINYHTPCFYRPYCGDYSGPLPP